MPDLPCIAHETHPSYFDLVYGYEWYKNADPQQRHDYTRSRLQLINGPPVQFGAKALHTSGSTGRIKKYLWGPGYESVYSFYFNNIVRSGSRLNNTVIVTLVELRSGADNFVDVKKTPGNPVADTWLNIGIGRQRPLPELADLLAGRDVVVPPSHYEILHKYVGIGDQIDDRALLLSTGEALSDFVVCDGRKRNREVRDWMRSWDGGASFYTCQYGNRHWCDFLASVECRDGRLLSTDLYNLCQRFESYHNGDMVTCCATGRCPCGEETLDIQFVNRQDVMHFQTPTGNILNYTELVWLVARARMDMGLRPDDFHQVCFGVSLSEWFLRVDYVDASESMMSNQERGQFLVRLTERGRALGFRDVSLRDRIEPSGRKLNRLYTLDGASLLQSSR